MIHLQMKESERQITTSSDESGMAVILSIQMPSKNAHEELIQQVGMIEGVTYAEKM